MNTENKQSLGFLLTKTVGEAEIFKNGNKFYYFSRRQGILFPISKKNINF